MWIRSGEYFFRPDASGLFWEVRDAFGYLGKKGKAVDYNVAAVLFERERRLESHGFDGMHIEAEPEKVELRDAWEDREEKRYFRPYRVRDSEVGLTAWMDKLEIREIGDYGEDFRPELRWEKPPPEPEEPRKTPRKEIRKIQDGWKFT